MPRQQFDRLFFAIILPPHIAEHVAQMRDAAGAYGRAILDRHLHVTLFMFEDLPRLSGDVVARAKEAAAALMVQAFRIVFDMRVAGTSSLLLLPSEAVKRLVDFQRDLEITLRRFGLKPMRGWRFNPHITLRRGQQQGAMHGIDPLSWTVDEFALVHSLVGLTRHVPLERWPLPHPRLAD